ncbi:protein translocase subunit SecD [Candidatus Erwinia haradaeae]|uniref:Protein translocase subunit SecD n=1 Tax=Candidatus Erwinia haradaeae TaxID=1922217 RepID=A0A451DA68_9GAMM|nr:protein translocase subunit SecD [Candidatus Erwinia haradaeae]VFP83175.1 Protein translocase subunit SecD [Candidatus Erwinia haradaeae]
MLNHYPLWKYIMLLCILFLGFLYAIPNLYGEDPAIQVTGMRGRIVNDALLEQIQNALRKDKVQSKSIIWQSGEVLARFTNTELQLKAREVIKQVVGKNYIVALNLVPATPRWLACLSAQPMKLGLDLRGGVHFLIEVDTDMLMDKMQEQNFEKLHTYFNQQNTRDIHINKSSQHRINIHFRDENRCNIAYQALAAYSPDMFIRKSANNLLMVDISTDKIRKIRADAVQQNIHILRNRVTQLGLADTLVKRQGDNFIIVELPGIQDTARAKEILSATAMLEFRLVRFPSSTYDSISDDYEAKETPEGHAVMLYKKAILSGNHINNSSVSIDEYNQPQVNIALDSMGGDTMAAFTKDNIGRVMATLLIEYRDSGKKDAHGKSLLEKHEEIINVAYIQSPFSNHFRVSGIHNSKEARQLALLLRSGALTSPIRITEERIIGPTMAVQNIKKGLDACAYGLIACIVFMVVRYKLFGLVATCALLANLVLIVSIMSILPGVTLTMPGIAGIVLTLVVAVDANILINERIKEELHNGRFAQHAISMGYQGAFSSILDANITTLIKVIILYTVGSGSIQGFAITTAIGIATSMLTSMMGTRAIINLIYGRKRIDRLSI